MLRSTGEKGLLYGYMNSQPPPTAAMALRVVSGYFSRDGGAVGGLLARAGWCTRHTYMMQSQSKMYDPTSFIEGTPTPRMLRILCVLW